MPRLFVLDAMNLTYRAYYVFIRRPLINSRGENTSAIYGFANTVLKLRREERPDYWALAWDGPGKTHRHERYSEYKALRKPMPEDLLSQIPAVEEMAAALGLPVIEVPGVEADDVMATLATLGARDGFDVVLVTSDKDLAQLVDDRVKMLSPVGRGEDYAWVDRAAVIEKWGVTPEQTRDVLALMGDTSDNVPGVPGIGPKTASELIHQFGSLAALYENLERVPRAGVREKLAAYRAQAFMSQELVTVRTDCDLAYPWEALRCGPIRREELTALARRYELQRLERIAAEEGADGAEAGAPPPRLAPGRRGGASETPILEVAPAPPVAEPRVPATAVPPGPAPPIPAPPVPARVPAPPVPTHAAPGPRDATPAPEQAGVAQGALDLWGAGGATRSTGVEVAAPAVAAGPAATAGIAFETRILASSGPQALEARRARLAEVRARAHHGLALLPLAGGPDARTAPLVGLAVAARDGTAVYLPLAHVEAANLELAELRDALGGPLADPNVPKLGEDLKRDAHLLAGAGLALAGFEFDVHIGSFLCDPDRDHGLAALAHDFLGMRFNDLDDVAIGRAGRARVGAEVLPPARAGASLEPAAAALFPLAEALRAQLEAREQWALYRDLEHPLIPVLTAMERAGIALDADALRATARRVAGEIAELERALTEMAGEPVNLNSGAQLAHVLFETLQLPAGRRTKTGFSTDQAVLEELASRHEFPARLLEYRALTKLASNYLEGLPAAVDPRDGRVHTTYNPVGAATGRLSSSNPNLQNIPIRTPQGREIRRAFVAAPGALLVSADYSQIELRLMAHLSGDPNLIAAFHSGEDVHANTARRIFNVTGDLDPALRSRAKVVNYGIMYGMGARSLSQQMKIPLADAKEFIANYFRVFAGVRDYLDRQVEEATRRGYAQTLLGRRRWLPALAGPQGAMRAFAERVAVNAPIQGSAADLIKLAMVRVHDALKEVSPSARLLLQVHDELLVESPAGDVDAVSARLCAEMQGAWELRVPLEVSVGHGPTWFDAH